MKFSADDFKELYGGMPDEELRSLVRDELSEVARPVYDAELARRGLQARTVRRPSQPISTHIPPEVVADADEPLDESVAEEVEREEEEDLAPAAIFKTRDEAKNAKAILQTAAIPAFLEDDTVTDGGFRLLVAASYVVQARAALAEE